LDPASLNNAKSLNIENNTLFNSTLSSKFGFYVSNAANLTLRGNNISHTDYHIYLSSSNGNTISDNQLNDTITAWMPSIYLVNSFNNTIVSNNIHDVFYGIWIENSNATIHSNKFNSTNNSAIVVKDSNTPSYIYNNNVSNVITTSASSIYFSNANNSYIYSNKMFNLSNGISLFSSYYNLIYNNLINASSTPAYDENYSNYWNTTYN
jgi:parallel beta-helix repeat protein